jgi:hypothetical protein
MSSKVVHESLVLPVEDHLVLPESLADLFVLFVHAISHLAVKLIGLTSLAHHLKLLLLFSAQESPLLLAALEDLRVERGLKLRSLESLTLLGFYRISEAVFETRIRDPLEGLSFNLVSLSL